MNATTAATAAQGAPAGTAAPAAERRTAAGALRAIKVFAAAAVSVVLLGEYSDKQPLHTV
ncbi:hypothetical protein ACFP1Z_20365 [Streptomyces gamaensis]|uniref:Uncharacterized protein n=1 Tax=Streptomyces gamaensis TaxID=1763542 RepID=A0ABW0Z100_9ACTN